MSDNPRIEDLRRRVQKDPASIAFAQLAEEYRRAGLRQEAIDTCRAGLARHPGYLSARVTLGRALLELGELDEAQHQLQTVLKSATENLAAIRGLAEIHHARGALNDALMYYKAALALARNDPELGEMVADLSKRLDPQPRPDPENGLSFAQMEQELALHAGGPAPPLAAAQSAPPLVEEVQEPDSRLQAAERAAHVVAALEQWLTAIAADNVARTQPRA